MRANKASLQEFQLVNCMETHGRSGRFPESESCQCRLLVVIHPLSSTSQEELQYDPYEFELPARDTAPGQ